VEKLALSLTSEIFACAMCSYRLAPEFPYPIPFDDCVRATVHFLQNAAEMNVDPSRIAIAGMHTCFHSTW